MPEEVAMLPVAIVDDEVVNRDLISAVLETERIPVREFESGEEFLKALAQQEYACVLLDIRMPGVDGLEVLRRMEREYPELPVVMTTGVEEVESVVEAMKLGAFDYLTKPLDVPRLIKVVEHAREKRARERELAGLRDALQGRAFQGVIGSSESFQKVVQKARRLADSAATVLLIGESGTGKEVLARAIHEAGPRSGGPFVAVNCVALPETLLESELFGHERGAFTGADRRRLGRFEAARGGTLLLDEIGDLPVALQPKLLRVLESRRINRVGSNEELEVDVRVIAATNRNLEQGVREQRFRSDLFYRINTVSLTIPALRERPEDLPVLAVHFLEQARARKGRGPQRLSEEALQLMLRYRWPGNVRELKNSVEHAVVLGELDTIQPEDLPDPVHETPQPAPAAAGGLPAAVRELEMRMLQEALKAEEGVKARAARRLGLTERMISYKIRRYGIH